MELDQKSLSIINFKQIQVSIKELINVSDSYGSEIFKTKSLNFKTTVEKNYIQSVVHDMEDIFLVNFFDLISFESLHKNTFHFLMLRNYVTKFKLCSKSSKAIFITKDILKIQPCSSLKCWHFLENILVFLMDTLDISSRSIFYPLREKIWEWIFMKETESTVSSLMLLDMFVRKFTWVLQSVSHPVLNLLLDSISNQDKNVCNIITSILASAIRLEGESSAYGNFLLGSILQVLEADPTYNLLIIIKGIYKRDKEHFKLKFKFSESILVSISKFEHKFMYIFVPLIYFSSPELFSDSYLVTVITSFMTEFKKTGSKRKAVIKSLIWMGDIIERHAFDVLSSSLKPILLEFMKDESVDRCSLFLVFCNTNYENFSDYLGKVFKQQTTKQLAKAYSIFIRNFPEYTVRVQEHIISELKVKMFSANEKDLTQILKILSFFKFSKDVFPHCLFEAFSHKILHQKNSLLKSSGIDFVASQQETYPEAGFHLLSFSMFDSSQKLTYKALNMFSNKSKSIETYVSNLQSLCYSRDMRIAERALDIILQSSKHEQLVKSYVDLAITTLNNDFSHNKRQILCLLKIFDFHQEYFFECSRQVALILYGLKKQTSVSIRLLSNLIKLYEFDEHLDQLTTILSRALDHNTSMKKKQSAILLITNMSVSDLFRKRLKEQDKSLYKKLIYLYQNAILFDTKQQIFQLLLDLSEIDFEFTRLLMIKPTEMVLFDKFSFTGYSDFEVYIISLVLTQIKKTLDDPFQYSIHEYTLQSLINIFLNYGGIIDSFKHFLVRKVEMFLISSHITIINTIYCNTANIIYILGDLFCILLPTYILSIIRYWDVFPIKLLMESVQWISYKFKKKIQDFLIEIFDCIIKTLHSCALHDAIYIFERIPFLRSDKNDLDVFLVPHLLTFIETNCSETTKISTIINLFSDYIKCIESSSFFTTILHSCLLLYKENIKLETSIQRLLCVLVIKNGVQMLCLFPFIVSAFNIKKNTHLYTIMENIENLKPISKLLIETYLYSNNKLQYTKSISQPPSKQILIPEPQRDWDSLKWYKWYKDFLHSLTEYSTNKAISSCIDLIRNDHLTQLYFCSLSFADFINRYTEKPDIYSVLCNILFTALESQLLPVDFRNSFLTTLQILLTKNLPLDLQRIVEISCSIHNFSLANRCLERIIRDNPLYINDYISTLMILGEYSSVRELLNTYNFKKTEHKFLADIQNWEGAISILDKNEGNLMHDFDCFYPNLFCLSKVNNNVCSVFDTESDIIQLKFDDIDKISPKTEFETLVCELINVERKDECKKAYKLIKSIIDDIKMKLVNENQTCLILSYRKVYRLKLFSILKSYLDNHTCTCKNHCSDEGCSPSTTCTYIPDSEIFFYPDNTFKENFVLSHSILEIFKYTILHSLSISKSMLPRFWSMVAINNELPHKVLNIIINFVRKIDSDEADRLQLFCNFKNSDSTTIYQFINSISDADTNYKRSLLSKLTNYYYLQGNYEEVIKNINSNNSGNSVIVFLKSAIYLYKQSKDQYLIDIIFQTIIPIFGNNNTNVLVPSILSIIFEYSQDLGHYLNQLDVQKFEKFLFLLLQNCSITNALYIIQRIALDKPQYFLFFAYQYKGIKSIYDITAQLYQKIPDASNNIDIMLTELCNISSFDNNLFTIIKKLLERDEIDDLIKFYNNSPSITDKEVPKVMMDAKLAFIEYTNDPTEQNRKKCIDAHTALLDIPHTYIVDINKCSNLGNIKENLICLPNEKYSIAYFVDLFIVDSSMSKCIRYVNDKGILCKLFLVENASLNSQTGTLIVRGLNTINQLYKFDDHLHLVNYDVLKISHRKSIVINQPDATTLECVLYGRRAQTYLAYMDNRVDYSYYDNLSLNEKAEEYKKLSSRYLNYSITSILYNSSIDTANFYYQRSNYIASLAASSALCSLICLHKREPHNILLTSRDSRIFNIDFSVFGMKKSDKVPFRMTNILLSGLDPAKLGGSFGFHFSNYIKQIKDNIDAFLELIYCITKSSDVDTLVFEEYVKNLLKDNIQIITTNLINLATNERNIISMHSSWKPWL